MRGAAIHELRINHGWDDPAGRGQRCAGRGCEGEATVFGPRSMAGSRGPCVVLVGYCDPHAAQAAQARVSR